MSNVIGYTKKSKDPVYGTEVSGTPYTTTKENEETSNRWIETEVKIWKKTNGKYEPAMDESGNQNTRKGYLAMIGMTTSETIIDSVDVLGVSTSGSGTLPLIDIASESGRQVVTDKTVDVTSTTAKEIVINQSALNLLGLTEQAAVGKKLSISFVVLNDLIPNVDGKVESTPTEYTIVGVVPGTKTSMIYVPFVDLRSMGISNYSQLKVVVNDKNNLAKVRRVIESGGYGTISVADTVDQITVFFTNVRMLLIIVGMVALAIASLGMFNTLTISLLERTREVGLMKAMGIKSTEIKELFLTESMMMGFLGGILGLFFGALAGQVFGIILSVTTVLRGIGIVQVSYVPPFLAISVMVLSVVIGVLTGFYPARRATKISALDALRYE
jgi:ABC-type antimicrobial peptide transport system permease subunit